MDYLSTLLDTIAIEPNMVEFHPSPDSRITEEIVLHLIRSMHYYLQGVISNIWEPLPYSFERYSSWERISELWTSLLPELRQKLDKLDSTIYHTNYTDLPTPAFGLNLIIELLTHHSHHIGQILLYLRLNGISPPAYPFIV